MNDNEILKLVLKILYTCADILPGQGQKQKDFITTFSKWFFHLGFLKSKNETLKQAELPDNFLEVVKNPKFFYDSYFEDKVQLNETFAPFFGEDAVDPVSGVCSTRIDAQSEVIPLRANSNDDILDSEFEEEDEEEDSQAKELYDSKDFMKYDEEPPLQELVKTSKFLPPLLKNQVLMYGTKNFYCILRYFVTLYERLKLAKNIVRIKIRADIKLLKEEYKYDTSKIEENFDKLAQLRFQ